MFGRYILLCVSLQKTNQLKQNIMTTTEINTKTAEIVELLSSVFIHTLKNTNFVCKQRVTDEVLRVLEFNGITEMRFTHPSIDSVYANLATICTSESSNAFVYKA